MPSRRTVLLASLAAAVPMQGAAQADIWPSRPIRFVVPFTAGGGSDVVARFLAEELNRILKATVIIENRAGQAGSIGADYVAKQPPDGYTMLICTPGIQMTNPFLYRSLPYDAARDFQPIIHLAELPNVLVVHPSLPARTTAELIAYARTNPGKLSFSSTGVGSSSHLAGELFKSMAGLDMVHVPYRGSSQAATDLISGRVQLAIDSFTAMMPFAREGSLRALGISTPTRQSTAPDLPAIAETLPGYDGTTLLYVAARSGTSREIVGRLNAAFDEALQIPRIRERMNDLGMVATGGTPDDLAAIIVAQTAKWRGVIESAKIRVD